MENYSNLAVVILLGINLTASVILIVLVNKLRTTIAVLHRRHLHTLQGMSQAVNSLRVAASNLRRNGGQK